MIKFSEGNSLEERDTLRQGLLLRRCYIDVVGDALDRFLSPRESWKAKHSQGKDAMRDYVCR